MAEKKLDDADRRAIRRVLRAVARFHEQQERVFPRLVGDGKGGMWTHAELAQHLRAADALLTPRASHTEERG